MTTSTQIVKMIEYHANPDLITIINSDKNFNPNGSLRKNSYLSYTVNNNNFEIFKAIINHPKFITLNNSVLSYCIQKILKRVDMADIIENRRFLIEVNKINYQFKLDDISTINSINLFLEIFNSIDKNNFQELLVLCNKQNINPHIFEIIFNYLKDNFNNLLTKDKIDEYFLYPAISSFFGSEYILNIFNILHKSNYDLSMCKNEKSIISIIKDSVYGYNKKTIKIFKKFNITYDDNFVNDIYKFGYNYNMYGEKQMRFIIRVLLFLKNNFDDIKTIYKTINFNTFKIESMFMINYFLTFKYIGNGYNTGLDIGILECITFLLNNKLITINLFDQIDKNIKIDTNNKPIANKIINIISSFGFQPNEEISKIISNFI